MKSRRPFSLLTLLSVALLLLHLLQPFAAVAYSFPNASPDNNTDFIRTSCGETLYPELCYTSLAGYANTIQQNPVRLTVVAIGVSLSNTRRMAGYLSGVSHQSDYGAEPRAAAALQDCLTVFGDAVDQICGSLKQMRKLGSGGGSMQFQLSNVQTWMSAALTNEETCTDGFEDVPGGAVKRDVCDRSVKVKEVTSNALALVNSYVSKVTTPP